MGATCVVQPLDLIKTRLQISGQGGGAKEYTGTFDAISKIIKREGMTSLYKVGHQLNASSDVEFDQTLIFRDSQLVCCVKRLTRQPASGLTLSLTKSTRKKLERFQTYLSQWDWVCALVSLDLLLATPLKFHSSV